MGLATLAIGGMQDRMCVAARSASSAAGLRGTSFRSFHGNTAAHAQLAKELIDGFLPQ